MSSTVIQVRGLGKKYRLGQTTQRYKTLRESLTGAAASPVRACRRLARISPARGQRGHRPEFWALRDVSFDVQQGDVLGIIGRNGAGKSTALKVLSRITEPTEGEVRIKGRVASLLEVGTGFNPELSGRDNVYLNGAILGMTRTEISRKFDEIVAFAQVEEFVDTQVKKFSSGMYLRLAFAVAAHMEPEILIVDEVLAVGDAAFQRKCLDKMDAIGGEGRTVIFVSHNMPAIARLCRRAILLDGGRLMCDGLTSDVTGMYLRGDAGTRASREWHDMLAAPGNEVVRLRAVRVQNKEGNVVDSVNVASTFSVQVVFEVLEAGHAIAPNVHFINEDGDCAFVSIDLDPAWRDRPRPSGTFDAIVRIPGNFLAEGTLFVQVALTTLSPFRVHVEVAEAVAFHVVDPIDGDSARGSFTGALPGVVRPLLDWSDTLHSS